LDEPPQARLERAADPFDDGFLELVRLELAEVNGHAVEANDRSTASDRVAGSLDGAGNPLAMQP